MLLVLASKRTASLLGAPFAAWAASGLLAPVLVIDVEAGTLRRADVVGDRTERTVAAELEDVDLASVRVLLVGTEHDDPDAVHAAASPHLHAIQATLPEQFDMSVAVLLAPSVPGAPMPRSWLREPTVSGVLLAGEDRRDGISANQLDGREDAFALHLAHGIISVGDAWAHTQAEVRSLRVPVGDAIGSLRAARAHSRVIDAGYLTDHLAYEALAAGDAWPNPDSDSFEAGDLDEQRARLLATNLVRVHGRTLDLTEHSPTVLPPKPALTLWEALKAVFRHLLSSLRRRAYQAVDDIVGAAYNRLAAGIERHDQGAGVRVRRWGSGAPPAPEEIAGTVEYVLNVEDGAVGPAWSDLAHTAFSLVDGEVLPRDVGAEWLQRGGRSVLELRPDRLVPHPRQLPADLRDDPDAVACDPRRFDPTITPPLAIVDEDGTYRVVAKAERTDDTGGAARARAEGEGELDEADLAVPLWRQHPVPADWLGPRRTTFVWNVGRILAENLRRAHVESVGPSASDWAALREAEAALPETERAIRRSWYLRMALWTVLAVVLGAAPWWVPTVAEVEAPSWSYWVAPPAGLLFWLWRLAAGWRRVDREIQAERQALARRANDLADRSLKSVLRRADAVRLERRYAEFLDWSVVIGHFVHEPIVNDDREAFEPVRAPAPGEQPAALDIGVAAISPQRQKGLVGRTRNQVFRRGWLTRYFEGTRDRFVEDWLLLSGRPVGEGEQRSGFADVDTDGQALRPHIRRETTAGRYRGVRRNPMLEAVLTVLGSQRLTEVVEGVATLEADELWRGPVSMPAVDAEVPSEVRGRVQRATVRFRAADDEQGWGGSGVFVGPDVIATAHHVVASADELEVEVGGTWCAVKVLAVDDLNDVALVRASDATAGAPLLLGDDRGLVIGSTLLASGYTHLMDGDPTLSTGAVTALKRLVERAGDRATVLQGDYTASGGASGGAVTDHLGRLVGIHTGGVDTVEGARDAGPISLFAPITHVRALIRRAGGSEGGAPPVDLEDTADPVTFLGIRDVEDAAIDRQHLRDPSVTSVPFTVEAREDVEGGPTTWWQLGRPVRFGVHRVEWTDVVDAGHVLDGDDGTGPGVIGDGGPDDVLG